MSEFAIRVRQYEFAIRVRQSSPIALGGAMHSLHSGLTFGPLGIAVTVLSGFCLVALSLLGLARWWQRWAVTLLASVRKAPLRTAEQNKKSRIGQPHL